MRILLIEDDAHLAELIIEVLADYNYVVDHAADGETGFHLALEDDYSLILLDVMLPKLDGITVCQRLRSRNYTVPILMMTARDASTDKVAGLDAGADDYVVKPVDLPELLARIRALSRRGHFATPTLAWGELQLNPSTYQVGYAETEIRLTPKEFSLLHLFLQSGQRVLSRRVIISHVWSLEEPPTEESLKTHIKTLRHKLKTAGAPADTIQSIRGVGYRLKPIESIK